MLRGFKNILVQLLQDTPKKATDKSIFYYYIPHGLGFLRIKCGGIGIAMGLSIITGGGRRSGVLGSTRADGAGRSDFSEVLGSTPVLTSDTG